MNKMEEWPESAARSTPRQEALQNIKEAIELYFEDLEAAAGFIREEQIVRTEVGV